MGKNDYDLSCIFHGAGQVSLLAEQDKSQQVFNKSLISACQHV